MRGNVLIGQSGGPTSVINASLAGIISASKRNSQVENVYGMRFGIEGMLQENIINLSAQKNRIIESLKHTPSAILGSCRYKVKDSDLIEIKRILEKYNVRYLLIIGGNDSMDTVLRIQKFCDFVNYEIHCIGVPKTVDNDLYGTDFSPGYPSAAKYVALSVKQSGRLARDMQKAYQFMIHQTVGRGTGWLAAASALAREAQGDAPHLIYLPERPINPETFLCDVESSFKKYGWVSISCGEGIVWSDGTPVSDSKRADVFSNIEFGATSGNSSAVVLHELISKELKLVGEFQITESLPMVAIDRASEVDLKIAYELGESAMEIAMNLKSMMVACKRELDTEYEYTITNVCLSDVANRTKLMPDCFISSNGNDVTEAFVEYLTPLVGELPKYIELEPIAVIVDTYLSALQ